MGRRRTKILTTLGPATDDDATMRALLLAGADLVRINFSHGDLDGIRERVDRVRRVSKSIEKDVGIMGDLQGPKIRINNFRQGPIRLEVGAKFALDNSLDKNAGDETQVSTTYAALTDDVKAGDILLLDDGQIVLEVDGVSGQRIDTTVRVGGRLSDKKGINRMGGGLSANALTEKDREDIKIAAELKFDYVAVSFPRDAEDIRLARSLISGAGGRAGIIAKIERAEAVTNITEIMDASDAVMVARGDLAVEIGDAELPAVQKQILHLARERNKVAIVATQMMESMISSPVPTRAEVMDVANAMMDGTDAVMLSAETAVGEYPVKTVEAMARVCLGAEKQRFTRISKHRLDARFEEVDEAIAMAVMYTANHFEVKAIIALTESGSTALWMSRIRSGIPIFALTRHEETRRRVTLYRGVYPVAFDVTRDPAHTMQMAATTLLDMGHVKDGDNVIITRGALTGVTGGTNTMKILTIDSRYRVAPPDKDPD
ncbi:MAG: pyruvate kinase [Pseudomonadota bacterium]